jgi:hypothetical protein
MGLISGLSVCPFGSYWQSEVSLLIENGKNGHQQPSGKKGDFKIMCSGDRFFIFVFCFFLHGLGMDLTTRNQRKKWSIPS